MESAQGTNTTCMSTQVCDKHVLVIDSHVQGYLWFFIKNEHILKSNKTLLLSRRFSSSMFLLFSFKGESQTIMELLSIGTVRWHDNGG